MKSNFDHYMAISLLVHFLPWPVISSYNKGPKVLMDMPPMHYELQHTLLSYNHLIKYSKAFYPVLLSNILFDEGGLIQYIY